MIFVDQFYNKQFINDRNTAENSNVKSIVSLIDCLKVLSRNYQLGIL